MLRSNRSISLKHFVLCHLTPVVPFLFLGAALGAAPSTSDAGVAASSAPPPHGASADRAEERTAWFVALHDEPTIQTYLSELKAARARGAAVPEQDANALAVRARQGLLEKQDALAGSLRAADSSLDELYRLQRTHNGIAVVTTRAKAAEMAELPAVKSVVRIEQMERHHGSSVPFIGAPALWGAPSGLTGQGISIGIIDTGIDYLHTNFGGPGTGYELNNTTVVEMGGGFPSAKVVGGFDFVGDSYNGNNAAIPDPDPMDANGHGSHVAGTAAGFGVNADGTTYAGLYNEGIDFNSMRIGPGVAPEASLYAIKVFGATGTTAFAPAGVEWATDPDGNGDFSDRLDVINLSLGSSYSSPETSPSAIAVNNAADLGISVVCSAGNAADVFFVTGSPGSAEKVLSVANSMDAGVLAPILQVTAPSSMQFFSAGADFGPELTDPGITADLILASPLLACSAVTNNLTGRIALIDRGNCSFASKVQRAQTAGAIGAIIINNLGNDPFVMGGDVAFNPTIPSIMVGLDTGNQLKTLLSGGTVTVTLTSEGAIPQTDVMNSGSSRGPARGGHLKPDISAPGTSIGSARALSGNDVIRINGTSMASPHVAGTMALLRELHPTWTAQELKALVINTAGHDLFRVPMSLPTRHNPSRAGSGRVDVVAASETALLAFDLNRPDAVHLSFTTKEVPPGTTTEIRTVNLVNKSGVAMSVTVSTEEYDSIPGVSIGLAGGPVYIVPANGDLQIDATLTAIHDQMTYTFPRALDTFQVGERFWLPQFTGNLTFTAASGPVIRLPWHATLRPVSTLDTASSTFAIPGPGEDASITMTGQGIDKAAGTTPNGDIRSTFLPFELVYESPSPFDGPSYADVHQIGVSLFDDGGVPTVAVGVIMREDFETPRIVSTLVYFDAGANGSYEHAIYNPYVANDSYTQSLFRFSTNSNISSLPLNGHAPSSRHTYTNANNIIAYKAPLATLGIGASFNCNVIVTQVDTGDEFSHTFTYNINTAPYSFGGFDFPVVGGDTFEFGADAAKLAAKDYPPVLLLFPHNGQGSRSQLVQPVQPVSYFIVE